MQAEHSECSEARCERCTFGDCCAEDYLKEYPGVLDVSQRVGALRCRFCSTIFVHEEMWLSIVVIHQLHDIIPSYFELQYGWRSTSYQ